LIKETDINKNVNKRFESELIEKTDMNKKVSKKFDSKIIKKTTEDNKKTVLRFVLKFKLFIFKYVKA